MRTRITAVATIGVAALGVSACEKAAQKPQEADKVVRDWIAAAANKDGKKYCGLMTPQLLQSITTQTGKMAKKTCEDQIKAGTGDYPFQFAIPKPRTTGATQARVTATGKKLRGHVTLRKQKGKLLIDAVR
ncbi:MAG: hypothetical protein M3296_07355 [Actinomycetota bacterium]|nr:hypothetical protein [Actinomycetota bacterium]